MIAKNKPQEDIVEFLKSYKLIYPQQIADALEITIDKAEEYFRKCRKEYRKINKEYKNAISKTFFLEWYKKN